MYLNKAFVVGNLTRDPETRALPSGSKVTSFSVATSRTFKNKEGVRQDYVEYHNITAFDKLGELCGQYLRKGQQVLVEGRIQTRSWEGQDGQKKYRTEIIAENVQFGSKPSGSSSTATDSGSTKKEVTKTEGDEKIDYPQEEINPDDIPF